MTWRLQAKSRIMRFDEELYLKQFSEVVFVDGKSQQNYLGERAFKANVQPLNGRDLLLVPEHQRFIEQYWVFVNKEFVMKSGNVIRRGQVHFQVQDVNDWGSYQECRVMRVDTGEFQTP